MGRDRQVPGATKRNAGGFKVTGEMEDRILSHAFSKAAREDNSKEQGNPKRDISPSGNTGKLKSKKEERESRA